MGSAVDRVPQPFERAPKPKPPRSLPNREDLAIGFCCGFAAGVVFAAVALAVNALGAAL